MSQQKKNSTFRDGQPPSTRELRSSSKKQASQKLVRSSTTRPATSDDNAAILRTQKYIGDGAHASHSEVGSAKQQHAPLKQQHAARDPSPHSSTSDATVSDASLTEERNNPTIVEGGHERTGDNSTQSDDTNKDTAEDALNTVEDTTSVPPCLTEPDVSFRSTTESKPRDECIMPSRFDAPVFESAEEYVRHRDRHRLRQIQFDMLMAGVSIANNSDILSVNDIEDRVLQRLSSYGVESVTYTPHDDYVHVSSNVEEFDFEITDVSPDNTVTMVNNNVLPQIEHATRVIEVPRIKTNDDEECRICKHPELERQLNHQDPMTNCKHLLNNGCDTTSGPTSGRVFENRFSIDLTLTHSSYGREYNFMPAAHSISEALRIIAADDMTELTAPMLSDDDLLRQSIEMLNSLVLKDLLTYHYCIVNAKYQIGGEEIRQVFYTY